MCGIALSSSQSSFNALAPPSPLPLCSVQPRGSRPCRAVVKRSGVTYTKSNLARSGSSVRLDLVRFFRPSSFFNHPLNPIPGPQTIHEHAQSLKLLDLVLPSSPAGALIPSFLYLSWIQSLASRPYCDSYSSTLKGFSACGVTRSPCRSEG